MTLAVLAPLHLAQHVEAQRVGAQVRSITSSGSITLPSDFDIFWSPLVK